MKLILTQEVDGLGSAGDVVEVKDGYGRNYLIPRSLGIRWTRGGEKQIESIKAARASRDVRDLDHAKEIKTKLESTTVNLPVRAGEGGRLFGAALQEQSPRRAQVVDRLSPRQREVAVLIGGGLTNEQIAQRLVLTPGTVANHVEAILRRLEVDSRTQVATVVAELGLHRQVLR